MIAIVGLGFVGLTTALGFAHKGYKVYGFDIDRIKRENFRANKIHFHEPYLENFLERYKNKKFFICESLEEAIVNSKIVFFCVGTPCTEKGNVDLKFLKDSITETLNYVRHNEYKILVIKSTIPPSTTQNKIIPLIKKKGFCLGEQIGIANNPEFLREGYSWNDFIKPDRIVIGEYDKKSGQVIADIYKSFKAPIYRVSLNSAEFIKYLSNTLLATMISFSNEMSMLADKIDKIDISTSFEILHQDKRWKGAPAMMSKYVYPGCGFGGYCLPKDTQAIYALAKNNKYNLSLLKEVLNINNKIKNHFVEKITKEVNQDNYIGILGLSFKPETDDIRDTPAKHIIKQLLENGYTKIVAYDPLSIDNFKSAYNLAIEYAKDMEEVIEKCDVIVILTAWNKFKENIDLLKNKKVIDGRYYLRNLKNATNR